MPGCSRRLGRRQRWLRGDLVSCSLLRPAVELGSCCFFPQTPPKRTQTSTPSAAPAAFPLQPAPAGNTPAPHEEQEQELIVCFSPDAGSFPNLSRSQGSISANRPAATPIPQYLALSLLGHLQKPTHFYLNASFPTTSSSCSTESCEGGIGAAPSSP